MTAGTPQGDFSGELDPALREALHVLSGEGDKRSPRELVDALQARFAAAGRQKLADLVYELVKACLAAFPDFAERVELRDPPRRAENISGEVLTMGRRLDDLDGPVDLTPVVRSTPEAAGALDAAGRGLSVLAHLEGRSDRHQLALALHHVHAGAPDEAEALLRPLVEGPGHDASVRAFAAANLALALHRAGRSVEALPLAEQALDQRPDLPANTMNLLACAGAVGDRDAFERGLTSLGALFREDPTPLLRGWIAGSLPHHAERMALSTDEALALARIDRADLDDEG